MPTRNDTWLIYTADEFAQLPLAGRPFLSRQGRTITRGFVTAFHRDDAGWTLDLRDVDYLDTKTGVWTRRCAIDQYASNDESYAEKFADAAHTRSLHLEVSGYGFTVFIGPDVPDPWTTIEWDDVLHWDRFEGGILGEDRLQLL